MAVNTFKALEMTPRLHRYVLEHMERLDDVQEWLIEQTRTRFGDDAIRQISPEQGPLLTMLVRLMAPRTAIEVGTFTGYSSLCIARGLPPDGRLLCLDISEEWTSLARETWHTAGVTDRVTLRLGPAIEALRALPMTEDIDFAFVDADKASYLGYHRELVPRMRPGGLIVYDNVLFRGEVVSADAQGPAAALRDFNHELAKDPRMDLAILPMADGITLARKR